MHFDATKIVGRKNKRINQTWKFADAKFSETNVCIGQKLFATTAEISGHYFEMTTGTKIALRHNNMEKTFGNLF